MAVLWSARMAISNVSVGAKILATVMNAIIAVINAMGRTAVTPTSVAGTGVSLSGSKIVVSAATSISANGCFTTAYDAHSIEFDLTTGSSANLTMVLRLSGTDATTAYDFQRQSGVNTTNSVTQSLNGASFNITITSLAGRHIGTVKLYGAAVAAPTVGTVIAGGTANPMTTAAASVYQALVQHRTATAYDGFTIAISSGNATGWVRIQGIA